MRICYNSFMTGKFVPAIAKKIHDENPTADLQINLQGLGIGDGFISPPETAIYAEQLYQVKYYNYNLRCNVHFLHWTSIELELEANLNLT